MTLHKEGKNTLFYLLVILIAINLGVIYLWPELELLQNIFILASILFYLLVVQFFRNPSIDIPVNENHVLAPADGKVVVIEETEVDEFLHEKRIQISIFMSPLNVHVNRSPVAGIVKNFAYHPGKYLVASTPKASIENEHTSILLAMQNGTDILVRQIAGFLARRIKWYMKEGHALDQGQEFGFIKFGSRVDVFLPTSAKLKVELNSKTRAGRTVLAELS